MLCACVVVISLEVYISFKEYISLSNFSLDASLKAFF